MESQFICKRCEKEFEKYESLRIHTSRVHKIKSEDFYVEFYCNNIHPVCKCGCGENLWFNSHGFGSYKIGHIARVKNVWSKDSIHFSKSTEKSANTRREQFKNGERKVWNDGLTKETSVIVKELGRMSTKENNPERAKKISIALTGVAKSDEHNEKNAKHWKEYWSVQENRDAQRIRRIKYMNKYLKKSETLLEKKFKKFLDSMNMEYEFQQILWGYNYDFLIKDTKILIEVDGDFWHSNPKMWKTPIYDSQINSARVDKIKNKLAKDNGYKLLRFWEDDVNNNPASVFKVLLNEIKV